jgi:hypothetical protein
MPTATYDSIFSYTLPGSAASVTLGSGGTGTIPSTYTDLVLVMDGNLTTGGTGSSTLKFNSDSGTNYSMQRLITEGTIFANADGTSNSTGILYADLSSAKFTVIINIMDYTNTNTSKTTLSHCQQTYMGHYVGRWNNTAVINAITLVASSSFASGTTFSLYGIKAGS